MTGSEQRELTRFISGIIALIGIIVSFIIFCFLRWQGYEQGQDLRNFLFQKELVRGTLVNPGLEEMLEKLEKEACISGLNVIILPRSVR